MEPRATDEEAIRSIARAYLESWLDGDGERMRGALIRISPSAGWTTSPIEGRLACTT